MAKHAEIEPGEYRAGKAPANGGTVKLGKAFMMVKPDGTGQYVNGRGEVAALNANQVKRRYTQGMCNKTAEYRELEGAK
jgi:hypothetical protein